MIDTTPAAPSLQTRLGERIRRDGPITFRDWMAAALYDEQGGYYTRIGKQRWGREGDYRTSPERSGLFAATFARFFAELYEKLDRPSQWTIVEAGAGDGSFANVLLTTLRDCFPVVFSATHYVIDEIGPDARIQLEPFADRVSFHPISETEVNPGIVFSNELLDAFPVHRITVKAGQLFESYVDVSATGEFTWALGPPSTPKLVDYFERGEIQVDEGKFVEVNLAAEEWLALVSAQITKGYLISVDYGSDGGGKRETLRGFKNHAIVEDVLAQPGEQDLTSSVDWTFVRSVGERLGLKTIAFERQDKFLLSAGLLTQLELESARATNDADRLRLSTAAREMILPNGMAVDFQVLVQEKVFSSQKRAIVALR